MAYRRPEIAKAAPIRWAYLVGGVASVASGFVGVVVPGWPTTIFMIIALYCFKRSSPRLEAWILSNRLVGPLLRDWDEHRWMTARAKALSIAMIWACILLSVWLTPKLWLRALLPTIAVGLTIFLLRVKTKPKT